MSKEQKFSVGDLVYHRSNKKISMVIIELDEGENEVSCRWVTDKNEIIVREFLSEELVKANTSPLPFV